MPIFTHFACQDTDLAEAVKKGKLTKQELVSWPCAEQGVWYAWRSILLLLVLVSDIGSVWTERMQGIRMHAMLAFPASPYRGPWTDGGMAWHGSHG